MIKNSKKRKSTAVPKVAPEPAAPRTEAPAKPVVPVTPPAPVAATAPAAPAVVTAPKPAEPRFRLELFHSSAKAVCVAGSFNGWKPESTPLLPIGNGRWVVDLKLGPGRYEYLFVVDGKWSPDPKATESVPNPYGGRNSVLIVSK